MYKQPEMFTKRGDISWTSALLLCVPWNCTNLSRMFLVNASYYQVYFKFVIYLSMLTDMGDFKTGNHGLGDCLAKSLCSILDDLTLEAQPAPPTPSPPHRHTMRKPTIRATNTCNYTKTKANAHTLC